MTSDKPNPPIDFSRASEPPRSLEQEKNSEDYDEITHEDESSENSAERQMTIAHMPGGGIVSENRVD